MPSSILNSDDGVISGTSGLKNSGGDDAVLLIQTNGTTAQTVDSGQRTKFPTTIGVGGATPSASGSGISFPATQSASTNANTLDDYEEGTWTPQVQGASTGGSTTYTTQDGNYTKIGNLVFCDLYLEITAATGTGGFQVFGLPFGRKSSTTNTTGALFIRELTFTGKSPVLLGNSTGTDVYIGFSDAGGGADSLAQMSDIDFASTFRMRVSFSFQTS